MSTPLTDDQYSELVVALEAMSNHYANGYKLQPQHMLNEMYALQDITGWTLIYLTQWFGKLKPDSAYIPRMIAELCEERTNAACV